MQKKSSAAEAFWPPIGTALGTPSSTGELSGASCTALTSNSAHAERVTTAEITKDVAHTMHLFQERIHPKAFEVRVTVVGANMFALHIDARTEAGRADWRADHDELDDLSLTEVRSYAASALFSSVPRSPVSPARFAS